MTFLTAVEFDRVRTFGSRFSDKKRSHSVVWVVQWIRPKTQLRPIPTTKTTTKERHKTKEHRERTTRQKTPRPREHDEGKQNCWG